MSLSTVTSRISTMLEPVTRASFQSSLLLSMILDRNTTQRERFFIPRRPNYDLANLSSYLQTVAKH